MKQLLPAVDRSAPGIGFMRKRRIRSAHVASTGKTHRVVLLRATPISAAARFSVVRTPCPPSPRSSCRRSCRHLRREQLPLESDDLRDLGRFIPSSTAGA